MLSFNLGQSYTEPRVPELVEREEGSLWLSDYERVMSTLSSRALDKSPIASLPDVQSSGPLAKARVRFVLAGLGKDTHVTYYPDGSVWYRRSFGSEQWVTFGTDRLMPEVETTVDEEGFVRVNIVVPVDMPVQVSVESTAISGTVAEVPGSLPWGYVPSEGVAYA